MRLYARKRGWSLSDRFLKPVMRNSGHKIEAGDSVKCTDEVEIFIALGLEYKVCLYVSCDSFMSQKTSIGSTRAELFRCTFFERG